MASSNVTLLVIYLQIKNNGLCNPLRGRTGLMLTLRVDVYIPQEVLHKKYPCQMDCLGVQD